MADISRDPGLLLPPPLVRVLLLPHLHHKLCRGEQGSTERYTGLQGGAGVHREIHRVTGESRGPQRDTQGYRGEQGSTEIHRVTGESRGPQRYTGLQGRAGVHREIQGYK